MSRCGWPLVTASGVGLLTPTEALEVLRGEVHGWGLRPPLWSEPRAKNIAPGMPRPSELRPNVVRDIPGDEERDDVAEEYVEAVGGTLVPVAVVVTVMEAKAVELLVVLEDLVAVVSVVVVCEGSVVLQEFGEMIDIVPLFVFLVVS